MRRRQRIYLLNRYFFPDESATAQLLTDLAHALAPYGDVVVLCSRQLLEDPRPGLAPRGRLENVRIWRLWSTAWGRRRLMGRACDYLTFLLSVGLALLLHLRRGDIVVAKTDPPLLGVVAVLASLGRGTPVVHWLQDLYPETAWRLGIGGSDSLAGRCLCALRDWSLRRGRLTVAVSRGMQAYLEREAGLHGAIVIPNWSKDLHHPGASSYREMLGLGGKFVIGYSGNLGRAHPVDGLIALAERLRHVPACHFLFTGGGVHADLLRNHIASQKIPNWSFLPYQPREKLADMMSASDLHLVVLDPRLEHFVFPSKFYGVLAAGRPVLHIGDPKGELAAMLREYKCGWTLAVGDPNGLAERLAWLRDHPQIMSEAGHNARMAYERYHAPARALDRWISTLEPLLE